MELDFSVTSRKLISIVTPCYNEEVNLEKHFARVTAAIEPFRAKYDFEHIYTDNSSSDRTFEVLTKLASANTNIRAMRFSRNIGANRAIYMGLTHAKGDAAILIQADLQDPPELIPEFIQGWEEGYDVVYGKILNRREGFILNQVRKIYYKIITKLSDVPTPENAGEFRLTSRTVLNAIALYQEDDLYLRGAIAHIGYKQKAVPYRRHARAEGKSSTNLLYLIGFALNGLISTTVVPIRAVIAIGFFTTLIGMVTAAFLICTRIFFPSQVPSGVATLVTCITFFSGAQLFALGVIGEYIRKIYIQSLHRPQGFIQDKIGF